MSPTTFDAHDPLWYKDAIIYQTHVKAFFDHSNDGVGDFKGLMSKLDYIESLGVTALWLLPFYPSPLRDDGYDIGEYRAVNPDYGTIEDVRLLIEEAHRRGLRVITELVINHTSDQHEWFQKSRRAMAGDDSVAEYKDFYVWSDSDQRYPDVRIIFLDTEPSNWTWDPVAKAYFWHRFFSHQPDLNFDNPRVLQEVLDVMHFWLDMGVDGLRLDAIPYLIEREGTNCENLPETHAVLKQIRAELDRHYPDRMLLAEANQWPEDTRPYFGDGDECHMAFHFPVMPRMYMAVAQEDRHPITDIVRQTPEIPDNCQWAIFLRNHDELTLEMVTDRERDYLWDTYAKDRRMRLNLGIRRRLAPLMDNDRRKIELMNSLLLSLPGTPVIYYGDELGMGDNIYLGDRDGVRTPMQWTPDRNAGFSRADPQRLYLPPVMDSVYGYEAVNVESQERDGGSLLNWVKSMIRARKSFTSFSRGSLRFHYPLNRAILAYTRESDGEAILCVVNLSRRAQAVELDLGNLFHGRVPVELLGRSRFPPIGDLPYLLTLPPYGFYWFLLADEVEAPNWHDPIPEPLPEFITLVMSDGWQGVAEGRGAEDLAKTVLPQYLPKQRWFGAKDVAISGAKPAAYAGVPSRTQDYLLMQTEVQLADQTRQRYLLPLAVSWGEEAYNPISPLHPYTLAKVRRGRRAGALHDAFTDDAFPRSLIQAMRAESHLPAEPGEVRFSKTKRLDAVHLVGEEAGEIVVRRLGVEQSNSSVLVGEQVIMKLYRRLTQGIHPEIEIGRHLTDTAGYASTPPLLGAIEQVDPFGQPVALGVAYAFVPNQGDGWNYTLGYLERLLDDARLMSHERDPNASALFEDYLARAQLLGMRTGEMHRGMAVEAASGDDSFGLAPITPDDMRGWQEGVRAQLANALRVVKAALPRLEGALTSEAQAFLAAEAQLRARIAALGEMPARANKIRVHGDYHLGQVLIAQNDVYLIDFEGEPRRTLEERRAKHTPMKDVAGMLRSFDYAAAAIEVTETTLAVDDFDLDYWIETWRRESCAAFLRGYQRAVEDDASLKMVDELLTLMLLDKALYEIGYEAANRPSWLPIPIRGVLRLLDNGAASATETPPREGVPHGHDG